MSKKVKVWIDSETTITLYMVPPTVFKTLTKLIAEYEVKPTKPSKKKK